MRTDPFRISATVGRQNQVPPEIYLERNWRGLHLLPAGYQPGAADNFRARRHEPDAASFDCAPGPPKLNFERDGQNPV